MPQRSLLSLLFLCFAQCLSMETWAQSVVVTTQLDSTSILVGEQVRLQARVSCDARAKVVFPQFPEGTLTPGVEVLNVSAVDTMWIDEKKRYELTCSYLLTSFDSALYQIPQLAVKVNGKPYLSRNIIGLKVNNIAVDSKHPDNLRPAHPPTEAVFVWTSDLLRWCVLLWLLMASVVGFRLRLSRKTPITRRIKVKPPTPPHILAIKAIQDLRQERGEEEKQKQYIIRLTDVLRTYINDRFGFNAREMTTLEIIEALRSHGDAQALDELREVLSTADLIKFARYRTTLLETDRMLLQAAEYVQTTKHVDAESEKPKEKIIVLGDTVQLRVQRLLKAAAIFCFLSTEILFLYILFLLWINFF